MDDQSHPPVPKTMRAFAIDAFGETGTLRELPTPTPGPDEVLVRVHAAGVNPFDLKVRDGARFADRVQFPFVLGNDCGGIVAATGPGVWQYKAGSRIFGAFWMCGTFAEYVCAPVLRVAVSGLPTSISFTEAAALPTPMLAAQAALCATALEPGQTTLLIGATGAVGSFIIQLAAQRCERVIATARPDAEDQVRKLGAKEVIDHTRNDLLSAVKTLSPSGVDALIDLVSDRSTFTQLAATVRPGGKVVSAIHSADVELLEKRGYGATNIDTIGYPNGMDLVARLMIDTPISIPIVRTYPLEKVGEALARLQAGHARGKIVLTIP